MKDVIDFERLCVEAVVYASPKLRGYARQLYKPVIREPYRELERFHDAHDRIWATRIGLPFHADEWDNRRTP